MYLLNIGLIFVPLLQKTIILMFQRLYHYKNSQKKLRQ